MTAAYRLKGIGWFMVLVGVVLGFYLISLQVATERKKLDGMNRAIAAAERDIRALETEFDTRANLSQLEKWNGDTLALAAPVAAQFVSDAALATLDPHRPGLSSVQTAALVVPAYAVPALPEVVPPPVAAPAPARVAVAAATATARTTNPRGNTLTEAIRTVAPSGRDAPAIARLAEAARVTAAMAKVRPQAVAMLDRKLLSDTTFGDIMSGARREAGRNR
ncbi:hypothetical protein [Sphingomonas sp.]|jgi:hypothetical protein|uniref:hypothetical protein n=1 Tax=Sphingomonas sp. TaxID=28214 RepID=UPI002D805CD2|nr:hypothetical protein [Sphingomonas sp.]HEU0044306.1 hypothetical protein [Sphingomonas sp.]